MTMALDRAPARRTSLLRWVWLPVVPAVAALVVAALWPALRGVPFWDDLYSLIAIYIARSKGDPAYLVTADTMAFWRPAELVLISLLRPFDPVGYLGVKLAACALHALKALAIVLLVRRIAPSLPSGVGIMAGLIALAHPLAVSVMVQIDTISEAFAACAVAWAFVLVVDAVARDGSGRRGRLLGAALLGAAAMTGKESAVPAVIALPLVALLAAPDRRRVLGDLVWFAVLLASAVVLFVVARSALGFGVPATEDGRYALGFGINVVRNLAVIAGALSFSGNTVDLIGNRNPVAALGFMPVVIGLVMVVLALALKRKALFARINGRIALAALVLAFAATAAPSLAPMISEHNAALPSSAALAFGLALIGAAACVLGTNALRLATLSAMLAIGLGLAAMAAKADAVAATGDRAAAARAAIDTWLYGHDHLFICIQPNEGRAYSIYQLPAERWIREEVVLARQAWPAKEIDGGFAPADGAGCDLTFPNFPPRT